MDIAYLGSAEKLIAVVQELSLARTLDRVQQIVRVAARELTNADGATFVLRDGEQCFYADENAIAPLWKGLRFPLSACVSGWSMLNKRPAVIEDIYRDERIPTEAYRPTFVKSLVMVPIRSSEPVGAIGNYWASHRMPTRDEVRILQALADSTAIALENVKLYGALEDRIRECITALDATSRAEAAARRELEERKRAEEALRRTEQQLRQAQKMEAVGQLAGGIAHDFNNVLSVVLTFSSILLDDMGGDDPIRPDVEEIQKAGQRAATLTHQLLAFSRQQLLERRVLDVSEVVGGIEKMLRRLIGEHIQLHVRLAQDLPPVMADAGQLEQVLVNLVVNARDAMPDGGRLVIETADVFLERHYASAHLDVDPGRYAVLSVSDSGTGIDSETQARMFEPFFTTKEKGKGTGLGLSTVYGIVKQSGGHVAVVSSPGLGTTFKVYLPQHSDTAAPVSRRAPVVTRLSGAETVLLVEDDEQVRAAVRGILKRNGYSVLEATSVAEAIRMCETHGQRIDLLLTDVVMPQMNGVALARRLSEMRTKMRVLCMSGYTDASSSQPRDAPMDLAFVQKPITPESLLLKVRAVLDDR